MMETRRSEMTHARARRYAITLALGLVLIGGCAAGLFKEETVAERFDTAMKKLAERCAKNPPKPGNTDCDPLKLKPGRVLKLPAR